MFVVVAVAMPIVLNPTPNIGMTASLCHTLEAAGYDVHTVLSELLDLHFTGQWGDLCDEDKRLNDAALKSGDRILSRYDLETEINIYIITDAAIDENGTRETTTAMLVQDY